jgi:translation initiation factor IF-2
MVNDKGQPGQGSRAVHAGRGAGPFSGVPMAGDSSPWSRTRRAPAKSPPIAQEQATKKRTTAAPTRFEHMFSALNTKNADRISDRRQGRCAGFGRGDRQLRSTSISTDEIKVRVLHRALARSPKAT